MEPDMHSIHVIATTYDGTRAAIETAVLLARASHRSFGVLVPKVVPYPLAAHQPPAADDVVDRYKRLIEELGGEGHVRICLCRSVLDVIERLTIPGMTLVVGGPS